MKTPSTLLEIDAMLQAWAAEHGGEERRWPVLIGDDVLERAGYREAFPHLLMTAAATPDPLAAPKSVAATCWHLSPAVCYHAYASLEGQRVDNGVKLSASGHCFRNEEPGELKPGRRQIEFQMRELILIGMPEWIEESLTGVREEIAGLGAMHGLPGNWEAASDPFFLPQAQGKAHMQRLLGTKVEYCLSDGLAISSINRHGAFFGERFSISLPDGAPAHSACIAFGLDRWASQSNQSTHRQ